MKAAFTTLAVMALATLAGCNKGTPGGPGTISEQPIYGQADNTFNLSVPMMSTSLQQGEMAGSHDWHQAGQELRRRRCDHLRRYSRWRDG